MIEQKAPKGKGEWRRQPHSDLKHATTRDYAASKVVAEFVKGGGHG